MLSITLIIDLVLDAPVITELVVVSRERLHEKSKLILHILLETRRKVFVDGNEKSVFSKKFKIELEVLVLSLGCPYDGVDVSRSIFAEGIDRDLLDVRRGA